MLPEEPPAALFTARLGTAQQFIDLRRDHAYRELRPPVLLFRPAF